jgi:rare lipoprotein A (peptidoglycan hydrolase)
LRKIGLVHLLWVLGLARPLGLFGFASGNAEAEEDDFAFWYRFRFLELPTATGGLYEANGYRAAYKTLQLRTKLVLIENIRTGNHR